MYLLSKSPPALKLRDAGEQQGMFKVAAYLDPPPTIFCKTSFVLWPAFFILPILLDTAESGTDLSTARVRCDLRCFTARQAAAMIPQCVLPRSHHQYAACTLSQSGGTAKEAISSQRNAKGLRVYTKSLMNISLKSRFVTCRLTSRAQTDTPDILASKNIASHR